MNMTAVLIIKIKVSLKQRQTNFSDGKETWKGTEETEWYTLQRKKL